MENNKEKRKLGKWSRRAFIGAGGLVGVGLVVGVGGYVYIGKAIKKYSGRDMGDGHSLNAWIRISPDNKITLAVARAEMGQGVTTSVAQLIAEELEVNWEDITVMHPQPESPYSNTFLSTNRRSNPFVGYDMMDKILAFLPLIATGGSTTIIDAWDSMRYAGATAREMLISAASAQWGIDRSKCKAENGYVINMDTNEKLSYGALSESAAQYKSDKLPKLKSRSEFKVVGKPIRRNDIPAKVNGTAKFGLDIKTKGMLYAAVKHANKTGYAITSINNETKILKMPGVKKVVLTQYGKALVIADNSWRAMNASKALSVTEENDGSDPITSAYLEQELNRIVNEEPIATKLDIGDVGDTISNLSDEEKLIEATYTAPYLAHACLEPMNATVIIKDGKVESWIGHQASSVAHTILAESTGIDKENITINITFLGGGFGRRSEPDFVRLAGAAAKAMPGVMIQTIFSREEDTRNDMYRPGAVCKLKGIIDKDGNAKSLSANLAIQSVEQNALKRIMPAMAPSPKAAKITLEGIDNQPYSIPNHRASFGDLQVPIQVGFWRSVSHSQNGFFNESFIDEMAHTANKDPLLFRLSMVQGKPRYTNVLNKLAQISNWRTKSDPNVFRGIAMLFSYSSIVAEVAEIRKVGDKEFKIENYYCVIDCGNIVNPDTIKAQMESGIIFGLTAALYGEITWKDGSIVQSNFHDYPMLKLKTTPKIHVEIMDVDELPGGVGEPATPPAAPALTNAIYMATGERIRSLPLSKLGYSFV
ncbi:MAG: xanthine dehydrogenase family protein molybdopterin-binding subunit [Saprospiraceae bacterium]|nr:xanthine dehydrogenase family protein molybdopterin-binding subunit [Saprospiraceae bacterium]